MSDYDMVKELITEYNNTFPQLLFEIHYGSSNDYDLFVTKNGVKIHIIRTSIPERAVQVLQSFRLGYVLATSF